MQPPKKLKKQRQQRIVQTYVRINSSRWHKITPNTARNNSTNSRSSAYKTVTRELFEFLICYFLHYSLNFSLVATQICFDFSSFHVVDSPFKMHKIEIHYPQQLDPRVICLIFSQLPFTNACRLLLLFSLVFSPNKHLNSLPWQARSAVSACLQVEFRSDAISQVDHWIPLSGKVDGN